MSFATITTLIEKILNEATSRMAKEEKQPGFHDEALKIRKLVPLGVFW